MNSIALFEFAHLLFPIHLVHCWMPLLYLSVLLLYLLLCHLYFLSLLEFSLCALFSWPWWASLWLLFWNLYLENTYLNFFKVIFEVLACSFLWNMFLFFFPFSLSLSVGFYALATSYPSHLEGVISGRRWALFFTLPYLLIISETLMIVQGGLFVLTASVVEGVPRPVSVPTGRRISVST